MASILKVDTLTGVTTAGSISVTGEGNSTTTNLQQGLAKAWLKYNQATPGVDNSLNVTSVTDNATAKYTINFTNNWANINYTNTTGGSYSGTDGTGASAFGPRHPTGTTSAQTMIAAYGNAGSALDWISNETSHNGDLA